MVYHGGDLYGNSECANPNGRRVEETDGRNIKKHGPHHVRGCYPVFRQVVNQRRIPFEIVAPDVPNRTTRKAMKDAMEGKNLSRSYDSVDDMWKDLNA